MKLTKGYGEMPLGELIERLEKATEGSRELDNALAEYIGFQSLPGQHWAIPSYTSKIDAAVTLVPDGYDWRVGEYRGAPNYKHRGAASAVVTTAEIAAWDWDTGADGATPAIALCLASIKARIATVNRIKQRGELYKQGMKD